MSRGPVHPISHRLPLRILGWAYDIWRDLLTLASALVLLGMGVVILGAVVVWIGRLGVWVLEFMGGGE